MDLEWHGFIQYLSICPTFSMLMNVYPATWVITGALVMGAYLIIRKRVSDK